MDAWPGQRMCDELGEEDLILPEADVALTSGIRWKRPTRRMGGPLGPSGPVHIGIHTPKRLSR